MSEKLLNIIDFRDTVPYLPNSGPIRCSILIKKTERAKTVSSSTECLHPELPCFKCPLAQKVRKFSELDFKIARTPYGLAEHRLRYGSGENLLRTKLGAQASVLKIDDMLITGERLLSNPREGANGRIWLHLNGHFIGIPSRIPVAFQAPFALPADLKLGNILLTGDQVLSNPKEGEDGAIWLLLTGGFNGHLIEVPGSIPIALCNEKSQ